MLDLARKVWLAGLSSGTYYKHVKIVNGDLK